MYSFAAIFVFMFLYLSCFYFYDDGLPPPVPHNSEVVVLPPEELVINHDIDPLEYHPNGIGLSHVVKFISVQKTEEVDSIASSLHSVYFIDNSPHAELLELELKLNL